MFAHSNLVIRGGNFTDNASRTVLDKLSDRSAPNALYNSNARFDAPKCHPNTRLTMLEHIMEWIFGSEDREALILWLYGPAGAGKSAIMQSIAEKCAALDILLAAFFFFRSDGTRNHPGSFIATIAYQIATRIPQTVSALDSIIRSDPMIFDRTLDVQIQHLIVNPLRDLAAKGFFGDRKTSPRLILVDGLDECNGRDHQRYVLLSIARALQEHRLPLIFLIASRPEHDIKFAFNSSPLWGLWTSLVLDNSFLSYDDIRLFLNDSLETIKNTHPWRAKIPANWPERSTVNQLVQKSSGQFIYASVVIKYISNISDSPLRLLEVVMGLRCPRSYLPFADLDALYMHILSSVVDLELLMHILMALIATNDSPVTSTKPRMDHLSRILELEEDEIELALLPLSSIITIEPRTRNHNFSLGVSFSHASFPDFLLDKTRSGQYHMAEYSTRLAHRLARRFNMALKMSDYQQNPAFKLFFASQFELFSVLLKYATLTDELYQELEQLPIHRIWSIPMKSAKIRNTLICCFVNIFNDPSRKDTRYTQLHGKYLSSLALILKNEITEHYSHPALKACMVSAVLLCLNQPLAQVIFWVFFQGTVPDLFQVPEALVAIDASSLVIMDRRRHNDPHNLLKLLISCLDPATPNHFSFNSEDYNQTALCILTFLCQQRTKFWHYSNSRPAAWSPREYISTISAARQRRVGKHQHGTGTLSFTYTDSLSPFSNELGTTLLPLVLEECSRSEKLVTFINGHINNIEITNETQFVRNAISRYLSRYSTSHGGTSTPDIGQHKSADQMDRMAPLFWSRERDPASDDSLQALPLKRRVSQSRRILAWVEDVAKAQQRVVYHQNSGSN